MSETTLILASSSPQRRLLLEQAGFAFETVVCPFDEPRRKPANVAPAAWAMSLAYFKAAAVAERQPERIVIGADTVVACGDEMLGKPTDVTDARRMLMMQIGRETDVISGVALLRREATAPRMPAAANFVRRRLVTAAITRVWMRDDSRYVDEYLDSGDWAGKAGAYGIQNTGDRLVERVEGSFSNVVGLPMELLGSILPPFVAAVSRTDQS